MDKTAHEAGSQSKDAMPHFWVTTHRCRTRRLCLNSALMKDPPPSHLNGTEDISWLRHHCMLLLAKPQSISIIATVIPLLSINSHMFEQNVGVLL